MFNCWYQIDLITGYIFTTSTGRRRKYVKRHRINR